MSDSFLTIAGKSEGFYREKGSKFIALAYPVRNEEDIKHIQENLRKEYYDAHHHCYAYVLDAKGKNYRTNDDGEPTHSAGDPILGQIRAKNLTNVLVIVIRYFGGIKLGVGGLISAYKTAAEEALNQAKIVKKYLSVQYSIETNYEDYNRILTLTKLDGFKIIDEQYLNDKVLLNLEIYQKDKYEMDALQNELYQSKFVLLDDK